MTPVDVVTTRSVLIYVKDKAASLREFYRVLKPGGRLSVFEPISALMRDPDRFLGYDIGPVRPLVAKLQTLYESIQLSPREIDEITAYLKLLVESGGGRTRSAVAFLAGAKVR